MLWTRKTFQSTFPIQGTTIQHPLRNYYNEISIHVPYTGNDGNLECIGEYQWCISIHVPYTGNDLKKFNQLNYSEDFNPRSLDRERLKSNWANYRKRYFNPRSLYRERPQAYPNINIKQHYFRNILRFSFNIFSSLIYIVIQYSIFVQLFWCESPGIFMYTSYSHYQIAI